MELLRGKFDASPHKSNASPWKIRYFSVQIKSFCVENLMFLSTNRKFPRAKFDASPYKSKAIESFSVENYTLKLGDLGTSPPPGQQIAENYVSGGWGKLCCWKDILSPASKWSRPSFIAANIFKKMLNFAPTVGRSLVMP